MDSKIPQLTWDTHKSRREKSFIVWRQVVSLGVDRVHRHVWTGTFHVVWSVLNHFAKLTVRQPARTKTQWSLLLFYQHVGIEMALSKNNLLNLSVLYSNSKHSNFQEKNTGGNILSKTWHKRSHKKQPK